MTATPDGGVTDGRNPLASMEIQWRPVLLGAAAQYVVLVVVLVRHDIGITVVAAGVLAGLVAGGLTGRYGPAMSNGLAAGALGGALAAATVALYGSVLSWYVGFGIDSRLAAQYGFRGVLVFVLFVPFHAVQGALVALVATRLRTRALERLRSDA